MLNLPEGVAAMLDLRDRVECADLGEGDEIFSA